MDHNIVKINYLPIWQLLFRQKVRLQQLPIQEIKSTQ